MTKDYRNLLILQISGLKSAEVGLTAAGEIDADNRFASVILKDNDRSGL
ncbi:MAG: hypothetical protein HZA14_09700 [Nitrospirae bacterium]|nr:hypothetical protein [Nitrospirota bacterium]